MLSPLSGYSRALVLSVCVAFPGVAQAEEPTCPPGTTLDAKHSGKDCRAVCKNEDGMLFNIRKAHLDS